MAYNTRSLEDIINDTPAVIERMDNGDLAYKPDESKWSKKEILGHLVDSAFYNLMRFKEVLFEEKPYQIKPYKQDELVRLNNYQDMDITDIIELWTVYNRQILTVIRRMSESEIGLFVHLPDNSYKTVEWLIEDYISHMTHHLNQIYN